jgi:hypothetical protein
MEVRRPMGSKEVRVGEQPLMVVPFLSDPDRLRCQAYSGKRAGAVIQSD